jgi:hypothetical protein
MIKHFILALGLTLLCAALSILWWRGWMYHGWPKAPGLLGNFLAADGEGSYDLAWCDMILTLLAVTTLSVPVGFLLMRERRKIR